MARYHVLYKRDRCYVGTVQATSADGAVREASKNHGCEGRYIAVEAKAGDTFDVVFDQVPRVTAVNE